MRTFLEWLQQINESMSIYVSGHPYHDDINDLDDLANLLKRKVLYPAWDKLPPEAQEAVRSGGSGQHMMLTPDGSYYNNQEEILNFYTTGWGEMIPRLVQGMKYFMDELGVKYGEFKVENSGMFGGEVVRIPILKWSKSANTPPLLNMSNANAHLIFGELLKFSGEEGAYSISSADLYRKIEELEKHQLDLHARDDYSVQKNGSTNYHFGLSSGDILSRLEQIKKIAKWALNNHYDQIHVA